MYTHWHMIAYKISLGETWFFQRHYRIVSLYNFVVVDQRLFCTFEIYDSYVEKEYVYILKELADPLLINNMLPRSKKVREAIKKTKSCVHRL